MAIISSTNQNIPTDQYVGDNRAVSWGPLANGDSGAPVAMSAFGDRSVQVTGTFGAGGTVVIEGSLDGTNYVTLNNVQGTAASFTAAGLRAISESTAWIRPRVTAGDGTTAITVTMMVRRG